MDTKSDNELKQAMLVYAPLLAADWERWALSSFKNMTDELGAELKGLYDGKGREWLPVYHKLQSVLRQRDIDDYRKPHPYYINEDLLKAHAAEYGNTVATEWYRKMQDKLVNITDVKVSMLHGNHGDITVDGINSGKKIHINQQTVFKFSTRGTPYHQFPALIYVNGKFTPEAEYKKSLGIKIAEKPVTLYKCGFCGYQGRMGEFQSRMMLACPKCGHHAVHKVAGTGSSSKPAIDPYSRPRQFKFKFTKETKQFDGSIYKREDTETAKGMTEREAWDKIYRNELRYGDPADKVYGQELIAIWSWNNILLWKRDSGAPRPEEPKQPMVNTMPRRSSRHQITSSQAGGMR